MCQKCVNRGLITQEQNDRIMNGEDPESVLSPEDIARMFDAREDGDDEPQVRVMTGTLDDAPDFIKALFADQGEPQSPEDQAAEDMDKAVEIMLDYLASKTQMASEIPGTPAAVLHSAMGKKALAEALAGELMFKVKASTIAYSLMVLTVRYAELLDQWSELYVKYARDADTELGINLDSATTPESKLAVTKAAGRVQNEDSDAGTGMYL